jgi:hypothetical protein
MFSVVFSTFLLFTLGEILRVLMQYLLDSQYLRLR